MKTEGELCHANRQADKFPVSYSGIKITTSKVKVFASLARPLLGLMHPRIMPNCSADYSFLLIINPLNILGF